MVNDGALAALGPEQRGILSLSASAFPGSFPQALLIAVRRRGFCAPD